MCTDGRRVRAQSQAASVSEGEGPGRNPADLAFLTPRTVRNQFLLFKLPSLQYFVMAALATNIASDEASL